VSIVISFKVEAQGPIFDGSWKFTMLRYKFALTQALGEKGVNWIKNYLPSVYEYLKNPSVLHGTKHFHPGLYESDIHTDRQFVDVNLIHDTPVVYGPWVEGVGSRNATTRFKGHHAFRLAAQQLNLEAEAVADHVIQVYIKELNA